jgi:hypothetical protein
MAEIPFKAGLVAEAARVVDPRDEQKPAVDPNKPKDELDELCGWVMNHITQWRSHRQSNYELMWDQYERLWRGIWMPEDKNKKSEKATLVTPALGEAVENIVAEVEEAVFGHGDMFDLKGDLDDTDESKEITDKNKAYLKEDLARSDFTGHIGEALINAAVYGTGIAEIIVKNVKVREIANSLANIGMPPMPGMQSPMALPMSGMPGMSPEMPMAAGPMPGMSPEMPMGMPLPLPGGLGMPPMQPEAPQMRVKTKEVQLAHLQSVNPRNFLIDPTARNVDDALGVAVEEYVGAHIVRAGQKSGAFRDVEVGTSAGDTELMPDRQVENEYVQDKVKVVRYYGLVPKHLLFPPGQTADLSDEAEGEEPQAEEFADLGLEQPEGDEAQAVSGKKSVDPVDGDMIEAIVVIANDGICLKAVENPYAMEDRPVVAFPWDIVPGRFWGRGVCEKGMVPQRVLDAELRARLDALAYVSAPMMGMDASRLPRGFQLKVAPGKSILTNGKPSDILFPMHFGQLEQSTFNHSQQLDQMVQRATGSLDVISLASRAGGDARPGAVSMMLSGIVKRHKRTLMGFLDRFYVPALRKMMWRNMQFYPERYTPLNWTFNASSSMGILQREYETQQLVSLMQTMEPQSKEYKLLLMGVVSNTGLAQRTQIMKMIEQSIANAAAVEQAGTQQQVDPMQAKIAAAGAQLTLAKLEAEIAELRARANLQTAKAGNEVLEPEFRQAEIATKGIYAVQENQAAELDRRLALVDRAIQYEDIQSNERIAKIQTGGKVRSETVKSAGALASEANAAKHANAAKVAAEHAKGRANVESEKAKGKAAVVAAIPSAATELAATLVGSQGKVIE